MPMRDSGIWVPDDDKPPVHHGPSIPPSAVRVDVKTVPSLIPQDAMERLVANAEQEVRELKRRARKIRRKRERIARQRARRK